MASISAALIVRNESALLDRCLKSLSGVDQIVIIDTGSQDDTKLIASKYTTDLYDFAECNDKETGLIMDFALARNESIRHCTKDWILWIDADEYLEDGSVEKLRKLTNEPFIKDYDSISLLKDTGHEEHYMPWIFRNNLGIRFFDPIHETPGFEGRKPITRVYRSNLKKFAETSPAHEIDPDRNFRILFAALKKEPANTRYMYYIGREFLSRQDQYGCYYWFKRYAAIAPNSNEKADVYHTLALIALDAGDMSEGSDFAIRFLHCLPSAKAAWKLLAALSADPFKKYWTNGEKFADDFQVLFKRKQSKK
jgi:glycosyltransferase involved in cell wall biosynthesis